MSYKGSMPNALRTQRNKTQFLNLEENLRVYLYDLSREGYLKQDATAQIIH